MAKTCFDLFGNTGATIIGDSGVEVSGISYRSDSVQPGDAFFCIVGFSVDGHSFAQDAIDRGASVIVAQRNLYLADATGVTVVMASDTRQAMAEASCAFYDDPSSSMKLVGITGTNGKTTTSYLVEEVARHAGLKTGVIGTVGIKVGDEVTASGRTTPEAPDLQRMLAQMRDAGCDVVAMEVSSHALDLKRVWGCDFAVTAFTNLTQDHLDYHHTFEAYFEAKSMLFGEGYPASRVIGAAGEWGRSLAVTCKAAGDDVATFSFDASDSIHPDGVEYSASGTSIDLACAGGTYHIDSPLVGRFNVENVMCAFGIGVALGIPANTVAEALGGDCCVPGRLERVSIQDGAEGGGGSSASANEKLPSVYVDYAHTPDALEKAISSVSELGCGRLIVVFGCGGDRDREKRPIMGEAAMAADFAIVTSDNPRTEDSNAIIADILGGMPDADAGVRYEVIEDRSQAIAKAIEMAAADDLVLLAGKGHEDYQELACGKVHFDDREQARLALQARAALKSEDGVF